MAIWFSSGAGPGALRAARCCARELAGVVGGRACWSLFVWPWGNERRPPSCGRAMSNGLICMRVAPGSLPVVRPMAAGCFFIERAGDVAGVGAQCVSARTRATDPRERSPRPARAGWKPRATTRILALDSGHRSELNSGDRRARSRLNFERYLRMRVDAGQGPQCRRRPRRRKAMGTLSSAAVDPQPAQSRRADLAASAWLFGAANHGAAGRGHWPPATRAARATGTCCSPCSPSSSTTTSINLSQAWVTAGQVWAWALR